MSLLRVLVVDNYDSFTWNLVHYLIACGADVVVRRNDELTAADAVAQARAVVISPGPGTPDGAGISLDLVTACARAGTPLLGVCLGHQAIAQAFSGTVVRGTPMHGKTSAVTHDGGALFEGLPTRFTAARYHSLVVAPESLPRSLRVSARTADGAIMALDHVELPIHGVQFHPESVAGEHGHAILRNFLALARDSGRGAP